MANKCIYCNCGLEENYVVDICQKCGVNVWGGKMYSAIVQNMENAREAGDLYQGSVSDQPERKNPELATKVSSSFDDSEKNMEVKKEEESSYSFETKKEEKEVVLDENLEVNSFSNDDQEEASFASEIVDGYDREEKGF